MITKFVKSFQKVILDDWLSWSIKSLSNMQLDVICCFSEADVTEQVIAQLSCLLCISN